MAEYDNTNSGALFKNDKKESDRHPDMRGSINFNGQDCWLSAWKKVSKNGQPYLSLSVTPKDDQPKQRSYGGGQDRNAPRPNTQPHEDHDDDDIPF